MPAQNVPQRIFQIHTPDPLQNWLRDFALDVRAAGRTEATIEFYREKLGRFLAFLRTHSVTDPAGITPTILRAFLVELSQERTPGGVHAHWRAVRAFVRFLVREEAIERNPLDKVRSPRVDQELLEPVQAETVKALLATCDKSELGLRDKAIILTLLDTGLRSGELVALNCADVDLNDGSVAVRKAKSRKGRIVFIGRQARRAVAAYLRSRNDTGPLSPLWMAHHSDGERVRLSYHGLRDMVMRRAKLAQVQTPSLHSFRRGFALTMLRNGADVMSLSRLMGHGSLPVLQRYLRQVKEDLGAVHERYSPADTL